jgi:hypothetical protein
MLTTVFVTVLVFATTLVFVGIVVLVTAVLVAAIFVTSVFVVVVVDFEHAAPRSRTAASVRRIVGRTMGEFLYKE